MGREQTVYLQDLETLLQKFSAHSALIQAAYEHGEAFMGIDPSEAKQQLIKHTLGQVLEVTQTMLCAAQMELEELADNFPGVPLSEHNVGTCKFCAS